MTGPFGLPPNVAYATAGIYAVLVLATLLVALLRWRNPELGAISPTVFIPIAEETGLIIQIGEWVIRESCVQIQRWNRAGLTSPRLTAPGSPRRADRVSLTASGSPREVDRSQRPSRRRRPAPATQRAAVFNAAPPGSPGTSSTIGASRTMSASACTRIMRDTSSAGTGRRRVEQDRRVALDGGAPWSLSHRGGDHPSASARTCHPDRPVHMVSDERNPRPWPRWSKQISRPSRARRSVNAAITGSLWNCSSCDTNVLIRTTSAPPPAPRTS